MHSEAFPAQQLIVTIAAGAVIFYSVPDAE